MLMITRADYVDFPPLMVEYLNYIDAIQNKSKNTISEYASDLRTFFRFMKRYRGLVPDNTPLSEVEIADIDKKFIQNITLTDAYAFLSYCKDELNNSGKTRARKVSSLRKFFKFFSSLMRCSRGEKRRSHRKTFSSSVRSRSTFWRKTPCRSWTRPA